MEGDIALYDSTSIKNMSWSSCHGSGNDKDYLINLMNNGPGYAIRNISADFRLLQVDNQVIPITICDFVPNNTYICSVYAQYIDYAFEELSVIKNVIGRKIAGVILRTLGGFLKISKIDKCIHVNNWLFPTNIYYPLSESQIKKITLFLSTKFPKHAILFRTLNFISDKTIIGNLQKNNYFLCGSRQVYVLTANKLKEFHDRKPTDLRRDEKILYDSGYEILEADKLGQSDIARLADLYKYLYLDKHSYLNPQFTVDFIHFLTQNPLFTIKVLKKANSIDAFIGCITRNNITYAPLFGYDTTQSVKIGLYRMLSAIKINTAMNNKTILHSSAGAGGFKRHRGHESTTEYHAVYVRHLSFSRKLGWFLLKWVINAIGMPIVKRYDT